LVAHGKRRASLAAADGRGADRGGQGALDHVGLGGVDDVLIVSFKEL
jgi:hypothetical protein